jgi:hypothetical protein
MPEFKNAKGRAIPERVGFSESKEKKTPYIEVMIQTLKEDGSLDEVIPWQGWLTPTAITNTIEQLKLLGARVGNDEIDDLVGIGSKEANVRIELNAQYGNRVAFIDPPGRSTIREDRRIQGAGLTALKAQMKNYAAAARGGARPPQPAEAPPWSPPPAELPSAGGPPAYTPAPPQNDDIPF